MMTLIRFYTFFWLSCSFSSETPDLYYLTGIDTPGEFSNNETKNLVEEDISKFDDLPVYQPTILAEMDPKDKNLGTKIT